MTIEAKIGIGIVHCQSTPGSTDIGFTAAYKSDYGKWSSIIDDTGAVFRHVKIEKIDNETILRMIHFSKDGEGWYMCSMKPIPGRDEEYRASWVYFPSSLDLSQKDIKNVIEVAESQIKQREFDLNKLQEVIHSYTRCNDVSPRYNVPTVQRGFAFRDTSGDINLFDLYGCMYQKEFTQYEWVILMDKSLLTFKGDGIEDISNRKILESHVIKPTSNDFGFIPYHNGVEFRSPVRIMDGEPFSIEFKKPGYITITKNVRTQADFTISVRECKKYFKKNKFIAYDSKTNKQIASAKIKPLNATEDRDRIHWVFEEQHLENAKIEIKADGYTADSPTLDLRNKTLDDYIKMPLDPESHEYLFVLPLDSSIVKDCDTAEVVISSQFAIKESPFKGFRCSGTPREGGIPNRLTAIHNSTVTPLANNANHNRGNASTSNRDGNNHIGQGAFTRQGCSGYPDDNNKKKWKCIRIVLWCILILAFVVTLGYMVVEDFSEKNTYTVLPNRGDTSDSSDKDWELAKGYLEQHSNQIRKGDMENLDDLKGLYGIINEYRFKDFIDYIDNHPHREDFLKIDVWNRLYKKAKEIGSNKKGVYNAEGTDQSITFENILNKDFTTIENSDDNYVDENNGQQGARNNGQQGARNNGQQGARNNGQQGVRDNGQQGARDNGQQGARTQSPNQSGNGQNDNR